jgi:FtsP/CotA-like multicopper oxidase with cupredoxin domain
MKALSYQDLRSATPNRDTRPPSRHLTIHLDGQMDRYIWTMNGQPYDKADPIHVAFNERVKITYVNHTMMAHPMHLHGMFVELLNGAPLDTLPLKHTIIIPPNQEVSVLLTANEVGSWAFHCHLLYHMLGGMMTTLVVDSPTTL